MTAFQVLTDYGDDETKWYRKVGSRYHIIRLTDIHSVTGEDSGDKWHCDLSEVDPQASNRKQALESCGPDFDEGDWTPEQRELAAVEAMHSYGASAPLGQWSGSAKRVLVSEAKRESSVLVRSPEAYEIAMSRPVNAIGSTAREYAAGDIDSAIRRGLAKGDVAAGIMAKMQGATIRVIKQSDMRACPHSIMLPEHYRPDGSCKCDDPTERAMMIREWGYSESDFAALTNTLDELKERIE